MITNDVGFISYTIFTAASYWNEAARESYRHHTGFDPQVELNDLLFAFHGAVLCMVVTFQSLYYPPHKYPHWLNLFICGAMQVFVILGLVYSLKSPTTAAANYNWFAYLRFTGFVKVASSFVKHIPQAVLNITRRSTVGFSFTMVYLDTVGGLFSLGQQGIRSLRLGSLAPFTSNMAQTVLAVESLLFDAFFIMQHLVWYTDRHDYDAVQQHAYDHHNQSPKLQIETTHA